MKNKLTTMAALAAIVGFSATVQAVPVNPFLGNNIESGQSILASASSLGAPYFAPDFLTIFWGVNKVGTTYTYSYQVYDTSTHGGPTGAGDTVDSFNVAFNTTALGALTGGNYTSANSSSVTWTAAVGEVLPGNVSAVLFFTSLLPPTLGNANAADGNPPSPWASNPGGQQVPIPVVPDGGMTVMLLGVALSGLFLVRKQVLA